MLFLSPTSIAELAHVLTHSPTLFDALGTVALALQKKAIKAQKNGNYDMVMMANDRSRFTKISKTYNCLVHLQQECGLSRQSLNCCQYNLGEGTNSRQLTNMQTTRSNQKTLFSCHLTRKQIASNLHCLQTLQGASIHSTTLRYYLWSKVLDPR